MHEKFRSTNSYKGIGYISYIIAILFTLSYLTLSILNIIAMPGLWLCLSSLFYFGFVKAKEEEQNITYSNTNILADIGFILGSVLIIIPAICFVLFLIYSAISGSNF